MDIEPLRLLVPPLRLMTAFMWQVAHDQNVTHFGKLEVFVSAVLKIQPDLLSPRQKVSLIIGLRTKMLLEMCRSEAPAHPKSIRSQLSKIQAQHLQNSKHSELENMQSHLLELVSNLLEDPVEKEYFFKRVYPVVYGPEFDKALQVLVGYFISRLEKFLPMPDFKQVSSWVDSASLWEECEQHLSQLEHLHTLSQNSNYHGDLGDTDLPSIVEDRIMASLTFQDKSDSDHCLNNLEKVPSLDLQSSSSNEPQDGNQMLYRHDKNHKDINATSKMQLQMRDAQTQTESTVNKNHIDVCADKDTEFDFDMETGMSEDTSNCGRAHSVASGRGAQKAPVVVSNVFLNGEKNGATVVAFKHQLPSLGQKQAPSLLGRAVLQTAVPLEVVTVIQVDQHAKDKPTECLPKPKELQPTLLQQKEIVLVLSDSTSPNTTKAAVKVLPTHNAPGCPNLLSNRPSHNNKSTNRPQSSTRVPIRRRNFKCFTCGLVFPSVPKWQRHRRSHMADRTTFTCVHCNREFKHLSGLRSHQQVRTDLKDPSLPQCLQPKQIRINVPAKSDPGQCRYCGDTFADAIEMRSHMKTHNGIQPYKCKECDKRFTTRPAFLGHMNKHSDEKPYLCSECGKQYHSLLSLKAHMRFHSSTERPCCPYCGKQFSTRGNLTVHMRQHTGEKPYVCSVCEKAFNSAGTLQVHMRIHTGERPYRCEVCGWGFITSSARLVHMRLHSGERPFACNHCRKRFNTGFDLKTHMYSHTGMRPFKCPLCPKSYIARNHLNRHLQTHGTVKK